MHEHLVREAPRADKFLSSFGADNVFPMKRPSTISSERAVESGGGPSPPETQKIADQIGRQLRGMYDGILNQSVPDRFLELVKRLEQDESAGGSHS